MDDHGGDLTRSPLAYPGEAVPGPRLVVGDCAHTMRPRRSRALGSARSGGCLRCDLPVGAGADSLDRILGHLGVAPLAERTPLLAVGSNAAASVVRHKMNRAGVSAVMPLLTGVVRHLAIGHTAYVSRGGYVPAAPVHSNGARTPVVLQLVDDDQLAAIDATEGGYDRVELRSSRYPLVVSGGIRPSRYHVYVAREGVLGLPETGRRFLGQEEVLTALQEQGIPHATSGEPATIAARFAESPDHRTDAKAAMADRGMRWGSGLVHHPAGVLRWPDVVREPRRRRRHRVARRRRR